MSFKQLLNLGLLHGTDKATSHNYLKIYAKIFERLGTQKKLKILEIGAGDTGASHKMWKDYLKFSEIHCFEPFHLSEQKDTLQQELIDYGVKVFQGNQLDRKDIKNFLEQHGGDYDVIIDDAAHMPDAIQISLGALFPSLKPGGLYIVEDLASATDRQDRIDEVNNNIKKQDILNIMHVKDATLWQSFQHYEQNKTWLSATLSKKEKDFLGNNIKKYKFFDDVSENWVIKNNLCVIAKK